MFYPKMKVIEGKIVNFHGEEFKPKDDLKIKKKNKMLETIFKILRTK